MSDSMLGNGNDNRRDGKSRRQHLVESWKKLSIEDLYAIRDDVTTEIAAKRLITAKLPDQPMETDEECILRFMPNVLVRYLLYHGGIDMNHLATINATNDERAQFAQLIGYSVSGYSELSYVSDEAWARVSTESHESASK